MFGFLKDKLKGAISSLSKSIDEEGKEEEIAETPEEEKEVIKEAAEEEKIEEVEEKEETEEEKEESEEKEEQPEEIKEKEEPKEEEIKEKEIEGKQPEEVKEEQPEEDKKGFFARVKERFTGKKEEKEEKEEQPEETPEEEKEETEEEIKEEQPEEPKEEAEEQPEEIKEKEEPKEEKEAAPLEEPKEEAEEQPEEIKEKEEPKEEKPEYIKEEKEAAPLEEAKGIIGKIRQKVTAKRINEKQFDDIFWDIEVALLENNVAVEVIEKIKSDLKEALVDKPIPRRKILETVRASMKNSINGVLGAGAVDIVGDAKGKKPFIICFVGINGSGKTTTIAKMARLFMDNNMSVVMAAADTFRAAAIDQLKKHADRLGIKLIRHEYGSDAAAVAFDAVKHAEARGVDIVLIDTAGRMHSNTNLMDEMKKIVKVANPDMKIFVGESITGNDCVEQARKFDESIGIDGIILSKADVDEKGGAAVSVSYVTQKPIIFIGTGQEYEDLEEFRPETVLESLGL